MPKRPTKDLIEIFGYSPDDTTQACRSLWNLGACPFLNKPCTKMNHDQSIIYGTCSVTSPFGDCIICPNRFYEKDFKVIRAVAQDAFGRNCQFLTYEQFIPVRDRKGTYIVALGQPSGKEVKIGRSLSMDWVLAKVQNGKLKEYVGIEVQSIDITGNYRDCWHSYKNLKTSTKTISSSGHGMNWANVHKRLIPQIIRKGLVYSRSAMVKKGLYFIVPDIVYGKFEDIIGSDIPTVQKAGKHTLTVHTYELTQQPPRGKQRSIRIKKTLRFELQEFADRFVSGPNLPSGAELDNAIKKILGTA